MGPDDVVAYGRDYSAREFTDAEFWRYQQETPWEPPVQFLGRYIGYPTNRKCISHYPGMYRHHWDAGRPVFLFHQIGYGDMEGGYYQGRAHAQTAKADAERVGWQGETFIVACMDRFYAKQGYRTLSAADLRAYMEGFRSVLGDRAGFYGFYDSMRDAVREQWASFYVQCGARSAHVPGIHAWQENNKQPLVFGTQTDILELYCSWDYAFKGGDDMPDNFTAETVKTWHAWIEDTMRRIQQIHINGFAPLSGVGPTDVDGTYHGDPNAHPPHWGVGGNLDFVDRKLTQVLTPIAGALAVISKNLTDSQARVLGLLMQLPKDISAELGEGLELPAGMVDQLADSLRDELDDSLVESLGRKLLGLPDPTPQPAPDAEEPTP